MGKIHHHDAHTAKDHERLCRKDKRVDKRQVVMSTVRIVGQDDDGKPIIKPEGAIDYVRPDFLDAYLADARTRWQSVEVSDEPCAGPGGYGGPTKHHDHLKRGVTLQQHLHDVGAVPLRHPETGEVQPGFGEQKKGAR